jgi:hypothetical protein
MRTSESTTRNTQQTQGLADRDDLPIEEPAWPAPPPLRRKLLNPSQSISVRFISKKRRLVACVPTYLKFAAAAAVTYTVLHRYAQDAKGPLGTRKSQITEG